jgi:protein SCO1/2
VKASQRTVLLPLLVLLLVLATGAAVWSYLSNGMARQVAEIGGPFTLVDGHGHTVTDRDLRGRYLLVYFGYTFCPDVCPTTLAEIAGALDKLGEKAKDVQPVFITVDPRRDTPQVVAGYTAAFSPRILGLTGTPEQIAKVAREYKVYFARRGEDAQTYSVDHSSILYLMGPDGRFIAPLRTDGSADTMANDIARHLG